MNIATKILKIIGQDEELITFVEDRPGHDFRYSLDSTKIRLELNWKPTFSFKEALTETIHWYMNNESWWKPLATKKILSASPWKN